MVILLSSSEMIAIEGENRADASRSLWRLGPVLSNSHGRIGNFRSDGFEFSGIYRCELRVKVMHQNQTGSSVSLRFLIHSLHAATRWGVQSSARLRIQQMISTSMHRDVGDAVHVATCHSIATTDPQFHMILANFMRVSFLFPLIPVIFVVSGCRSII